MQSPELPFIKRTLSTPLVFVISTIFYLLVIPINWLMTHLGGSPGLVLVRGKKQLEMEEKVVNAFSQYSPTKHDVFVNTFAKSGTNWMLQMSHQIAFLGEGQFENIHDVVTWPDMYVQMNGKFILPLEDTKVQKASPTHLRVIKSHLSAKYIPYNENARYIAVIRDPKDVLVSSYHFIAGVMGPVMPAVEHWLDSFLADNFPISFGSSWAEHTASYWALRDKPNVLVLSFKEMKKDLPGMVKQVADLLNIELTDEQMKTVITKSSFDYMKDIDDKFFPTDRSALPWMKVEMVRQGKEGNSKEMISLEQQRRIDEHFINELKALGSDFPYEEFCRVAQ